MNQKLPLWRAVLGFGALAAMFGVLAALTPAYVENYRLQQWMRSFVRDPHTIFTADPALQDQILARANALNGPLLSHDIRLDRSNGGLAIQMRYAVEKNVALYRVDLHFRSAASSR